MTSRGYSIFIFTSDSHQIISYSHSYNNLTIRKNLKNFFFFVLCAPLNKTRRLERAFHDISQIPLPINMDGSKNLVIAKSWTLQGPNAKHSNLFINQFSFRYKSRRQQNSYIYFISYCVIIHCGTMRLCHSQSLTQLRSLHDSRQLLIR